MDHSDPVWLPAGAGRTRRVILVVAGAIALITAIAAASGRAHEAE
jgi:hypothetical protein